MVQMRGNRNRTAMGRIPMTNLANGLQSANSIASLIEKVYDRIVNIADHKTRRNEIDRLHELLGKVRISRTLNADLLGYAEYAVKSYEEGSDKSEIYNLIDQLKNSVSAILSIIDQMAEEKDRAILYESEGFQELTLVANRRSNILDQLRVLWQKGDSEGLRQGLQQYAELSEKLGNLSHRLAAHGRELDRSLG